MGDDRDFDKLALALSVFEMTEDGALEWDQVFRDLHEAARRCGYRAYANERVSEWARRRVATYHAGCIAPARQALAMIEAAFAAGTTEGARS